MSLQPGVYGASPRRKFVDITHGILNSPPKKKKRNLSAPIDQRTRTLESMSFRIDKTPVKDLVRLRDSNAKFPSIDKSQFRKYLRRLLNSRVKNDRAGAVETEIEVELDKLMNYFYTDRKYDVINWKRLGSNSFLSLSNFKTACSLCLGVDLKKLYLYS